MEIREGGDAGSATDTNPAAPADPGTRYARDGLFAGLSQGGPSVIGGRRGAASDTGADDRRAGSPFTTVDGTLVIGGPRTAAPETPASAGLAEGGRPDRRGLGFDVPKAGPAVVDGRYGRGPVADELPGPGPTVGLTREGVLTVGTDQPPTVRDTDATRNGERPAANPFAVETSHLPPSVITAPRGHEPSSGAPADGNGQDRP